MAAAKGHPKAGGRKKGTPNKTTVAVREALTLAFDRLGGVDSLVTWAQANPTEYYKLYAKLLPLQITGANDAPVAIRLVEEIVDGNDNEDDPTPPDSTTVPQV